MYMCLYSCYNVLCGVCRRERKNLVRRRLLPVWEGVGQTQEMRELTKRFGVVWSGGDSEWCVVYLQLSLCAEED